jgi:hypothetical protein
VQKASAFAAFAAAALLQASSASAGVILEQPQIKKVLQSDDTPSAPAPKREIILPGMRSKQAPKTADAAKPAAKKAPEASVQGGDLDPKAVALPGTLALIGAGAFALTKLDEGFLEYMDEASCKDSGTDGAGYETAIKGGALAAAGKPKSRPASKPGTKKVKAGTKSGGTGFSLGGLLNKE